MKIEHKTGNILIIDTETTAIEIDDGEVIEVAAILYSVEHKTILQQLSTLLPVETNNAEHINKISAKSSRSQMKTVFACWAIAEAAKVSDYIIAHNAEFDKKWMPKIVGQSDLNDMQWICSCHDFEWPIDKSASKSLVNIALSLDVPIVSAHRALTDCKLLADCFSKLPDLDERLANSALPRAIYVADVSFAEKEKAKNAGFVWNSLVQQQWSKKMTDAEAKQLEFRVYKA